MKALLALIALALAVPQQTKPTAKPDLVVQVVQSGSCSKDAIFRVRNIGTAAAAASFVEVRLNGAHQKSLKVPELAAGAASADFSVPPPPYPAEGALYANADSTNVVSELDESNNTLIGACVH